ncbi:DUF427 domain-containing protein [Catellatospora sp. IY07-71]|uniref:DUF427 domain-containing protein n=1 Tax=Catellatospora sp. IY07-71 TaxID=2728827 RepID=UPI001FD614B1|nr:DUF427 domain-containing protein [Catellatospora sp. IY07-71]
MAESVWDYPRPPRWERSDRHVTARHQGLVVVDTRQALRVLETSHPPVYYVPRTAVILPLRLSGRSSFCEFKGIATFWDLVAGQAVVPQAAWSYESPAAGYEELAGAVAFYPSKLDECLLDGEPVRPQEGDFYGGWITGDIVGPFKGGPGTAGW